MCERFAGRRLASFSFFLNRDASLLAGSHRAADGNFLIGLQLQLFDGAPAAVCVHVGVYAFSCALFRDAANVVSRCIFCHVHRIASCAFESLAGESIAFRAPG